MQVDPTRNPDIAECFTHNGQSYRVTGWYKELPMVPPTPHADDPAFISELMVGLWNESHPDPTQEHKLMACSREEADWVGGYSVCGVLARIGDITREGRYVPWPDTHIEIAIVSWANGLERFQTPLYISKR